MEPKSVPPLPIGLVATSCGITSEPDTGRSSGSRVLVLLVISADGNDWPFQFNNRHLLDGSTLKVVLSNWCHLHIEAATHQSSRLLVYVDDTEQLLRPDFLLFRSFPNDIHSVSYRNQVLSLYLSGVSAVNSVRQVLQGMDRPVMHAEMARIRDRVGSDKFPVIDCKLSPNLMTSQRMRLIKLNFPTVIKVGSSYGGYGKIVARDQSQYSDVESVLALSNDFFTEEPFIEHEYEFRVQVIGAHIRCFRRNSSNCWKNQQGNVSFSDHPWNDKYRLWVDECRQLYGGMDMFALDVLHTEDGNDYIIEVNDYAMGFDYAYEVEDMKHVRELVLQRMNEQFCGAEKANFVGQFIFSSFKRGELKGINYLP